MSALLPEKGLENRPGQNNCFLNVCIQALWHLSAFRSQFLTSKDHVHNEGSCIYCALKVLFNGYQFSEEQVLPPTALRNTLAALHRGLDRFQVGELDDAAEALEAILTCLNKVYLVKGKEKEKKADESNPNSISNKVFGCPVVEVVQCGKCKKDIKPQGSDSFIYYTYVTEMREEHRRYPDLPFDALLKRLSDSATRSCPNDKCEEKKCTVRKVLLQQPQVFAVGLVWPTPNPTAYEIVDMLSVISQQIRLSNIFNGVPVQFTYRLKGMICYYGLHYDCYFYSSQRKQWLVFDDRVVKEVGASWEQLKDRCRRGRFHPSVLFYERVETGAPLPTTFTPTFNPQPITLSRNMFAGTGPTGVPGFAMAPPSAATVGYPAGMRPGYSPYHPAYGPQGGYVHSAYNGAAMVPSPAAIAAAHHQQQLQLQQQQLLLQQQQQQQQQQIQEQQRLQQQQQLQEQKRLQEQQQLQERQKREEERREEERKEEERKEVERKKERERVEAEAKAEEERRKELARKQERERAEAEERIRRRAQQEAEEEEQRRQDAEKKRAQQQQQLQLQQQQQQQLQLHLQQQRRQVTIEDAYSSDEYDDDESSEEESGEEGQQQQTPATNPVPPPVAAVVGPPSAPSPLSAPVMVEDLLSTDNVFVSAGRASSTSSSSSSSSSASRVGGGYAAAPPPVAAAYQQPSASFLSEFDFPSAPTALPSPPTSTSSASNDDKQPSLLSSVDGYNGYSAKIDSIGQSSYLSITKPGRNLTSASASSYSSRSPSTAASSLYSTSPASRTPSTSSSSSSSVASSVPAAPRKKPQTSAFTNLSSLLSN